MKRQWPWRVLLVAVVVAWLGSSVWPSRAQAETYGGSATAVVVTVPATGTTIKAATGALSISGGGIDASLLVGDIPSNLTGGAVALAAGELHSGVFGVGTMTYAGSSLGDVNLTVSGNQITTDFLRAKGKAHCGPGPMVDGESQSENLVINGQVITITGAPNQTVTLPNGTAIINEQVASIVGNTAELTVNALHVTTRDAVTGAQLADVTLATVDAKHGCEEMPPPSETEVEGSGFIPGQMGGKAKFGISAEFENAAWQGHVVFKDPSVDFSMKSTSITDVTITPLGGNHCQATITGTADTSRGNGATFQVIVQDNGEPGQGRDTFEIHVLTAQPYDNAQAFLSRGDIEIEGPNCGNGS